MQTKEINSYGFQNFDIDAPNVASESRHYVTELLDKFRNYFTKLGYFDQPPAPISSGIDPTVRLIGSGISTLKRFIPPFGNDSLPYPGAFILQRAVRTRNRSILMDDEKVPNWGSLFTNIVWITSPKRLKEATEETFHFFLDELGIKKENLMIRVKSSDYQNLWMYAEKFVENIEIDSKPDKYYTHQLGTDILYANSYNLALKDPDPSSKNFQDIGNIILHRDKNGKEVLVEIGFGDSTILRAMRGGHVIDWRFVPGLMTVDPNIRLKMADELITSVELAREGLVPSSKDNRTKLFKAYLHALLRHQAITGISMAKLEDIINEYERLEFPNSVLNAGSLVTGYLNMLMKKVQMKKLSELSPDELKLKEIFDRYPVLGNYQIEVKQAHMKLSGEKTTEALIPVIERFNTSIIVEKYKDAIENVGIWESESIVANAYLNKDDRILELGCGTGRFTFGLYKLGFHHITGIDLAKELIMVAKDYAKKHNLRVAFSYQDARKLQFPNESFDGIVFPFNGLMTIPLEENRKQVLSEIARVLRPSGYFIFTTHDRLINKNYSEFWKKQRSNFRSGKRELGQYEYGDLPLKGAEDDAFIHIPSMSEVRSLLKSYGFKIVYTRMRSKIATESENTMKFSADCRFWVVQKL